MRNSDRITQVLDEVEQLWRLHPDWRLAQLICNLSAWADPEDASPYDLEDDALIAEIHRHLAQVAEPVSSV